MKHLFSVLRYVPKKTAIVSLAALAVIVPLSAGAWGPTRTPYTIAKPATHVTFNSITDNPNIGDERNFVGIREDGSTGTWSDSIAAVPGKTYVVRMYVHNDAASNLNLVAHDVTAKFNLPTTTGTSIDVFGFLDSSNATPKEVYDQATFTASEKFNLAFVPGSLLYENNHFTKGTGFTDEGNVFTSTGVKLGYDKLNGDIPGCMQYAGYLTFKVKPQFAVKAAPQTTSFTMSKQVSKHGANTWTDSYAAQPGETVDFLVNYKNTGTVRQDNVVLKDKLPAGMTYVAGSTIYGNALHPSGTKASDNITGAGINVGSYNGGGNAWAIFSAKVASQSDLQCGTTTLSDTASVETDNGTKTDTASVTVQKTCQPSKPTQPVTPVTPVTPTPPETPQTPETPSTPETPPTPTPLPSTGPSEIIGSVLGSSSLGLGVHHYLASRRALRKASL